MHTIAIVGCAHIHIKDIIEVLKGRRDVKVSMVWDLQPLRALSTAQELAATTVADLSAIWEDRSITTVIVASETDLHEPLLLAAAAAGKDIFVEKPLAETVESAIRIAA